MFELRLDPAEAAIGDLAGRLGLEMLDVAEGIRRIANNNMTETIRLVSIERGRNPRDFAIMDYGGAGGLHACEVADELQIDTVVVPEHQGVLSALGLLASDFNYRPRPVLPGPLGELAAGEVVANFRGMEAAASAEFARYGIGQDGASLRRSIDVRPTGQASELNIEVGHGSEGGITVRDWAQAFHRKYRERFGHSFPEKAVELVNLRLVAASPAAEIRLAGKGGSGAVIADRARSISAEGCSRRASYGAPTFRPASPSRVPRLSRTSSRRSCRPPGVSG